jgi:hypothetical protein
VAHLPAHLYDASPSQSGGHQSGAGTAAPRFGEGDDGCVCAGADARQAEGAAEGRGDDAAGNAPAGTGGGDVTGPQTGTRRGKGISAKLLRMLASPTGFEPVLSP